MTTPPSRLPEFRRGIFVEPQRNDDTPVVESSGVRIDGVDNRIVFPGAVKYLTSATRVPSKMSESSSNAESARAHAPNMGTFYSVSPTAVSAAIVEGCIDPDSRDIATGYRNIWKAGATIEGVMMSLIAIGGTMAANWLVAVRNLCTLWGVLVNKVTPAALPAAGQLFTNLTYSIKWWHALFFPPFPGPGTNAFVRPIGRYHITVHVPTSGPVVGRAPGGGTTEAYARSTNILLVWLEDADGNAITDATGTTMPMGCTLGKTSQVAVSTTTNLPSLIAQLDEGTNAWNTWSAAVTAGLDSAEEVLGIGLDLDTWLPSTLSAQPDHLAWCVVKRGYVYAIQNTSGAVTAYIPALNDIVLFASSLPALAYNTRHGVCELRTTVGAHFGNADIAARDYAADIAADTITEGVYPSVPCV